MSERKHVKRQSTQTPVNRFKDTNKTQDTWHRTENTGHRTEKNLILAKDTGYIIIKAYWFSITRTVVVVVVYWTSCIEYMTPKRFSLFTALAKNTNFKFYSIETFTHTHAFSLLFNASIFFSSFRLSVKLLCCMCPLHWNDVVADLSFASSTLVLSTSFLAAPLVSYLLPLVSFL